MTVNDVSAADLARSILGTTGAVAKAGSTLEGDLAAAIEKQRADREADEAIAALSVQQRDALAVGLLKSMHAQRMEALRLQGPPKRQTPLDAVVAGLRQRVAVRQLEALRSVTDAQPSLAVRKAIGESSADRKVMAAAAAAIETLKDLLGQVQALANNPSLANFDLSDITGGLDAALKSLAPLAVAAPPDGAAAKPVQLMQAPTAADTRPADPATVGTPADGTAPAAPVAKAAGVTPTVTAANAARAAGHRSFLDPASGQQVHIVPVG